MAKIYLNGEDNVDLLQSSSGALVISGTDTYTTGTTPVLTSYVTRQAFLCIFTNANTGASTINIDTLGAKAIQKNGGIALVSGDIVAGQPYWLVYDGIDFQLVGKLGSGSTSPLTTKGDIYVYTTADSRLPVGTANQKLIVDLAEASGLKWVTEVGGLNIPTSSTVSAGGTATNALVFVGNEISRSTTGVNGGGDDIGFVVTDFHVPPDYKSGGQLKIWVRRSGAVTAHTVTAWINDVLDSTINVASIIATANVTWELKTLTFGSTLVPNDVVNLEFTATVGTASIIAYIKASSFTYNR